MPIFQDSTGHSVKFFVQKDIPADIQAELTTTIVALGGRVEAKVPLQGYILIQPGTGEAERLRICWTSPERPERHFVPYTYVEACKSAGTLLKQIFMDKGSPIPMHIHSTIGSANIRNALAHRITHSGGDPYATTQNAHVILADPDSDAFNQLVKMYQGVPEKHIESYLWVKRCIADEAVIYTPLIFKNPGGRRPGTERTAFTEEDEDHLCNYIAVKIPFKATGGRTGNRLYQQLCELHADPEYGWVSRHTWQSWRERYKKNAARLDIVIDQIVERNQPLQGENGQYGYVRKPEKRIRKRRESKLEDSSGPEPKSSSHGTDPSQSQEVENAVPETQTSEAQPTPDDEDAEDPEWAVKVGQAPPPTWAKRKDMDDQDDNPVNKKRKVLVKAQTLPNAVAGGSGQIRGFDHAVRDIASEFRFTIEEVQEFFDETGDLLRTRNKFQKMRQVLIEMDGEF